MMVVTDKSGQSWRLDPECFSDWSRLIRVYSMGADICK